MSFTNAINEIRRLCDQNCRNSITDDSKVAVLFVNSYLNRSFCLGEDVCNDGILCAERFKKLGYQVYVYFDVSVYLFAELFRGFISRKFKELVVYFTGHGMSVDDFSGDEKDGKDEALVFKDGAILDDDLKRLLKANKNDKLVLLTDCCHSGTIFDCETDDKITTFSAAYDSETAKQTRIEKKGNGVFTYYLWKYWDMCGGKLSTLSDMVNKKLEKYHQRCNYNHDLDELF